MLARRVAESDLRDIAALVQACRDFAAPTAFPGVGDVPPLFAEQASRDAARCWRRADGSLVAYVVAQEAFGNVLFDVAPQARDELTDFVVETGLEILRSLGRDTADTPLESDDDWRTATLSALGFADTGDDVVHLVNGDPHSHAAVPSAEPGMRMDVASNAADVDEYVTAHRAAFGTTYLTRARRDTWADDPGYDPELDLGLRVDGALDGCAALCGPEQPTPARSVG